MEMPLDFYTLLQPTEHLINKQHYYLLINKYVIEIFKNLHPTICKLKKLLQLKKLFKN